MTKKNAVASHSPVATQPVSLPKPLVHVPRIITEPVVTNKEPPASKPLVHAPPCASEEPVFSNQPLVSMQSLVDLPPVNEQDVEQATALPPPVNAPVHAVITSSTLLADQTRCTLTGAFSNPKRTRLAAKKLRPPQETTIIFSQIFLGANAQAAVGSLQLGANFLSTTWANFGMYMATAFSSMNVDKKEKAEKGAISKYGKKN